MPKGKKFKSKQAIDEIKDGIENVPKHLWNAMPSIMGMPLVIHTIFKDDLEMKCRIRESLEASQVVLKDLLRQCEKAIQDIDNPNYLDEFERMQET